MSEHLTLPTNKPQVTHFSSGPCAKHPGWSVSNLENACLGRSHRSEDGKAKLSEVIERSKQILGLPADYRLGIVPASDTGAVEMALWSLLGQRPLDILAWESFGQEWVKDVVDELKLPDVRLLKAPYGGLPNLDEVDFSHDVVFLWNGTTSGVRVPNGDWIKDDRQGLTICDATSAVFAMDIPWEKIDVLTYSWQKVLGGEAQHGVIVLSPRAVERLQTYEPAWPIPKIFRLSQKGKLIEGIFKGDTINTPSMLCVEDALDALIWAESVGGLPGLISRSEANLAAIAQWVKQSNWADFLAEKPETRSCTSICLKIVDAAFASLSAEDQGKFAKKLAKLLEKQQVAYDIAPYRAAPPGLRIWGGATVETADIEALLPWLDWAYANVKAEFVPVA
ncbi:phosphoserine aminotransferase apoenzyme [Trichormus variabilis ATCC 29413]|uniref:phosphoserine transaminase n=2 Tax=Anabaena variabilis TaxID=264691 RepID=Q3MDZ1_TRIV2|nr:MULTISPECIES: phosphoserine transaminase [Nostocaceae]ABA20795.1 phosphoserine aminotransferase apoenzyme [Trichormus variabilis ATCC 29413]MBC1217529.1 phosphoserine transaminase [Trichormus variabilis ARAD]MBC1256068.1 phosphoserine transaminase [Trichormus variabilis V5]MBC1269831.1 phosphoserine transaminase [Trichormus variabilis FSR]MBC1305119.1 phosphoserine transaminase [Trichormus variabilis N2B]